MLKGYIVYASREGDRKVISHKGYAFYQSTGTSSGFANTWFPFLGLSDPNSSNEFHLIANNAYGIGHFMKPSIKTRDIPLDVEKVGIGLGLNEDFFLRAGSLECLLISSQILDGYWRTEQGKAFKSHLMTCYPNFYKENPDIQLQNEPEFEAHTNEPGIVNDWLSKDGEIKQLDYEVRAQAASDSRRAHFAKSRKKEQGVSSSSSDKHIQENPSKPVLLRTKAKTTLHVDSEILTNAKEGKKRTRKKSKKKSKK